MNIVNQLPPQFRQFLIEEGIDEQIFEHEQTLRYIRIKPDYAIDIDQLREQICPDISPIPEIPNLYSLPTQVKLVNLQMYKDGLIYGIDKSSAAAVLALDINKDDHNVLEICCAPGAKLTFIADLLRIQEGNEKRQVYGVDISQNRLNIAQSLVNKYQLTQYVQLILGDGTTYSPNQLFDKVLIDAECTHEGSIKHLKKFIKKPIPDNKKKQKNNKASLKQLQKNHTNCYMTEYEKPNEWTEQDFSDRFLDSKKLQQIYQLQYSLLENGFKLLKQSGILVYSTCSFSKKQNEDIIIKFLNEHPDTVLIHPFYNLPQQNCKPGAIFNTVRFDPITSNTGGMFIAKIQKL